MSPSPQGTPSAEPTSGSTIWQKLKWLRQHPLLTAVSAIFVAYGFAPVWSQLVTNSDAYKALEAKKPIDGILGGAVWLLQGTIQLPVPLMGVLLTSFVLLVAIFLSKRAGRRLLRRGEAVKGGVPQTDEPDLAALRAERDFLIASSGDWKEKYVQLTRHEAELIANASRTHAKQQAEITRLRSEIEILNPPDLDEAEKDIIRRLALYGTSITTSLLNQQLSNIHRQHMLYHMDRLKARNLVVEYGGDGSGDRYDLSEGGRNLAVREGYI